MLNVAVAKEYGETEEAGDSSGQQNANDNERDNTNSEKERGDIANSHIVL
tara:strand:- start:80 stop:229 length:150 start_codon:yes stop_codon:yes gene_type:complete